MEIVSITALNLARMELELDLHLQQVGLNRFIEVACYTFGSNLENGCILKSLSVFSNEYKTYYLSNILFIL